MLKHIKYYFLISVSFLFLLPYCKEVEKVPETPKIEYLGERVVDTLDALGNTATRIDLEVYLVDGDGNIGLFSYDTISPNDTSKFYITEFRKEDGIFVEQYYEQALHYRLPYLQPQGQDKTLRCTIRVELFYNEPQLLEMDSIQYKLFVVDRSGKKSNTITTPEIILPN
ncbi:MAG: hypothetical protein JXR58_04115 [Bacteroidales bacterium]|nr:hypothetical protein [Bacteroidales bacterium]